MVAKLPNDILNGYSGSIQFIGLYGLMDMLDSLNTEVGNISNASSSFDEIIALLLKQTANNTINELKSFST